MTKRADFSKWVFRLNLIATGIVFFLLSPGVRVYRAWFPDKQDSLWLIPVIIILGSCTFWLLTRLSLPFLIRVGLVKELRKSPRPPQYSGWERIIEFSIPVLNSGFHLLCIVFLLASIAAYLREEPFKNLYRNIPELKRFHTARRL